MSMRSYCVFEYGVIFYKCDLDFNKVKEQFPYIEINEEEFELYDYFENAIDCSYYGSDFEGEAILLQEDNNNNIIITSDFILGYVPHFPSFYKAYYKDYEELKADIITNFSIYLKNDFDWDNRIVNLIGTIFG